jgi:hypothetical protein
MPNPETKHESAFHEAMVGIYKAAMRLKPPYRANRFLTMVTELGGREAANRLLATREPSDGFAELFRRGPENLKISVEYLVINEAMERPFPRKNNLTRRESDSKNMSVTHQPISFPKSRTSGNVPCLLVVTSSIVSAPASASSALRA